MKNSLTDLETLISTKMQKEIELRRLVILKELKMLEGTLKTQFQSVLNTTQQDIDQFLVDHKNQLAELQQQTLKETQKGHLLLRRAYRIAAVMILTALIPLIYTILPSTFITKILN